MSKGFRTARAAMRYYFPKTTAINERVSKENKHPFRCKCPKCENLRDTYSNQYQSCGHPVSAIVSSGSTHYCRMCEEEKDG